MVVITPLIIFFKVATFLGLPSTIVLISSLDIATKVIGDINNIGLIIYEIISFVEKVKNSIAVRII